MRRSTLLATLLCPALAAATDCTLPTTLDQRRAHGAGQLCR